MRFSPNKPAPRVTALAGLSMSLLLLIPACGSKQESVADGSARPQIVVTYSVLGSLVADAVGDAADVTVLIPNGADPHDWEPSAKDIERLNNAALIVQNGLDLEGGIVEAVDKARDDGTELFSASDHVSIRKVGEGEGLPGGDPDQAVGAEDPHLWMDPLALKEVITALGPVLAKLGIDVKGGVESVTAALDQLHAEVLKIFEAVPLSNRKLVTGHESMGYLADRYNFTLVGAIVPSLTTQSGVSAEELATLKLSIQKEGVQAIFTEAGTPAQVAEAIGAETGAKIVELEAHKLPSDSTYATFLRQNAQRIANALA
jgi:zinc/manganese transport system substrate-binding protein